MWPAAACTLYQERFCNLLSLNLILRTM